MRKSIGYDAIPPACRPGGSCPECNPPSEKPCPFEPDRCFGCVSQADCEREKKNGR